MIPISHFASYTYIPFADALFFTVTLLPCREGRFPVVIVRSPYVHSAEEKTEEELLQKYLAEYTPWLDRGYAVVFQHCRGQGKSTGAFVPYIHEHEDVRALRDWIRCQPFYNGELYLYGGSYTASLHYTSAPFEDDIKGAVLEVQDSDRYRLWYRNGQMRKGHANWHFSLYKAKCGLTKTHSMASFSRLPLLGLSEQVLGERAEDFEEMLSAPCPDHPFWQTRFGGGEAKNVTDRIPFPVLFTTGYQDYYVGGMFAMWASIDSRSRQNCAMLVSPYNHGDGYDAKLGLAFPDAARKEHFGRNYPIDWFDHIRLGAPLPYPTGKITYYRCFENRWESDFDARPTADTVIPLTGGRVPFLYDPRHPAALPPEGTLQPSHPPQAGMITAYTPPAAHDMMLRGRMQAHLTVSSGCPDTAFLVRISIEKAEGDYHLRHDITSLSYQLGHYTPHTPVKLHFTFDEYAFLLRAGERLRIDITSADDHSYVNHTNRSGPYAEQTGADVAVNTVYLDQSCLILPVEIGEN